MYEGKIVGLVSPDIPEHELGLLMAGAGPNGMADGAGSAGPGTDGPVDADVALEIPEQPTGFADSHEPSAPQAEEHEQ
jgi:hypothetical protein